MSEEKSISFDRVFDAALGRMGIDPRAVESFLSTHKTGARIAANSLSLVRIALGYIAIRNYEKARKKENKKEMAASMAVLGLLLASDAFDGYISRKAHISGSKSGKIIDSVSDVALRMAIAQSSLADRDKMDVLRGIGELVVASTAVPDMLDGKYSSTNLGKIKVNTDAIAIVSSLLKDLSPQKTTMEKSLKVIHDVARTISTGLAVTDGVKRIVRK